MLTSETYKGNRRDGLHRVRDTKGVIWGAGAVGNAVYSGCRLRDVLDAVGIRSPYPDVGRYHVAFESVEQVYGVKEREREGKESY